MQSNRIYLRLPCLVALNWLDGVRASRLKSDDVSDCPNGLTACKVCCARSPWDEQLYKGLLCQAGPNGLTLAGWQAKWAFTAALEVRLRP